MYALHQHPAYSFKHMGDRKCRPAIIAVLPASLLRWFAHPAGHSSNIHMLPYL